MRARQPKIKTKGAGLGIIFYALGMISVGFLLFFSDQQIVQAEVEYKKDSGETVKLTVPAAMKSPVFVFLKLTNFFQNHRNMAISLSRNQLEDMSSLGKIEQLCSGALTPDDLKDRGNGTPLSYWKKLDGSEITVEESKKLRVNPCGFMAWNFPKDVFTEIKKTGAAAGIPIVSDGRVNKETELLMPHEIRFINQRVQNVPEEDKKNTLKQWVEVENPRFENWMRTSSTPTFQKLWGIIKQDLEAGEYEIKIKENTFDQAIYNGTKNILISTSNLIGGRNRTTSMAFISVGFLLLVSGIFLVILGSKETPLKILNTVSDEDSTRASSLSTVSML